MYFHFSLQTLRDDSALWCNINFLSTFAGNEECKEYGSVEVFTSTPILEMDILFRNVTEAFVTDIGGEGGLHGQVA